MLSRPFRLGHVSDVHCTKGGVWEPEAWEEGVRRLNALDLDAVLLSGDLTDWGLRSEWEMVVPRLEEIRAPKITCLGNHDARREGWRVYEDLVGRPRYYAERLGSVDFVVLDSSEPDLDDGEVGREQRGWMRDRLREAAFPVVVLHHHLVPIPRTGREMNICRDAGSVLKVIQEFDVPLVLGGHRHVAWAWRLNETLLAHAGTFSSNKRQSEHTFNLVTLERDRIRVEMHEFPSGRVSPLADVRVPRRWGGSASERVFETPGVGA